MTTSTPKTVVPRRRPAASKPPVALHVLLFPEDGWILAHILEADIMTQGRNRKDALRMAEDAVRTMLASDSCDPRTTPTLSRPAAAESWRAIARGRLAAKLNVRFPVVGAATLLAYELDAAPGP